MADPLPDVPDAGTDIRTDGRRIIGPRELKGSFQGNGCIPCSPKCIEMEIAPSSLHDDLVCIYPKCCGVPGCPEYMCKCGNACYFAGGQCLFTPDKDTITPSPWGGSNASIALKRKGTPSLTAMQRP